MVKMSYRLVRTLPDGTEKVQSGLHNLNAAGRAAFYVLLDNGAATKAEADVVAVMVESESCGTPVSGGGYVFRVERES